MGFATARFRTFTPASARALPRVLTVLLVLAGLICASWSWAALRSAPSWWDPDGVAAGSDWHYRVPVTLPTTSTVNSTGKVDIDFAALMTQLGISGTFDVNSVRVVRPGGTLATIQEYTDTVYAGATDASGNNRGEVRWIVEDAGAVTYQVYFDVTQNGAKAANPQVPINGNFEKGAVGTQLPAGWATAAKTNAAYDLQITGIESPTITSDGIRPSTNTGPLLSPTVTDGTPLTGAQAYILGARTNNEPLNGAVSQADATMLTRTIAVPASNPGNLTLRWRVEGWDSDTNNVTTYDHLQIEVVGSTTTDIVGPLTNAYTTYPFAPSFGANDITNTRAGFGSYNTFDMTTGGTHRNGMTVANHAQPWWTRTFSLAPYAGQTITLRFSTTHMEEFKSWFHIDDVEWSVVNGTLGAAEAFGAGITNPVGSFSPGTPLPVSVRVDARPTAATNPVTADIYNNAGTLVASAIKLYNDGTHGDAVAGDAIWTNNGSDSANPTYTVPLGTPSSTGWTVRAFARDATTSTVLASANGLAHRNALPTPLIMANYWNIDETTFNVVSGSVSVTKISSVISDPVNGTTNPKAIPGAVMEYCILITNTGATALSNVVATDNLPANFTYGAATMRSGTGCAAAATVEDDNNAGADETDPYGASVTGSTLTGSAASLGISGVFALKFRGTVN